jgi:VWFA-related protein
MNGSAMREAPAKRLAVVLLFALALRPNALVAVQQTAETAPQGEPFKFESKVNVVIVPVLVVDSHGRALGDLKQGDFQVFDRGKRQEISRFTVQRRAGQSTEAKVLPDATAAATGPAAPAKVTPERFIAFLFDDLHLSAGDLMGVRNGASKVLAGSLQSTDMAAVLSTSGQTNTGFTRDQAKLQDAIAKLRPVTIYQSVHDCPDVSHYQAYEILYLFDATALEAAIDEALRCMPGIDYQTAKGLAKSAAAREMAMGEQGAHVALDTIREVVRQMGPLPGQHTLILTSPGFVALTPEATRLTAQVLDVAAQANVTVSALYARGLYTYMLDASQRYESGAEEQVRRETLTESGDVMEELASGTFGTFVHNSNDFKGGFERLLKAPEYVYLLEFHPQNAPQDGSYHRLKVKVNAKTAKIRARRGYFAEKPVKAKQANNRN